MVEGTARRSLRRHSTRAELIAARLAVTPGEPAGIGPELVARLAQEDRSAEWIVFADPDLLARAASRAGLDLVIDGALDAPATAGGRLTVAPVRLAEEEIPGIPSTVNAAYVVETLARATDACLAGDCAAVVTGPVQKSVINDAGTAFSGHTEFFCERTGAEDVVMLLVAGSMRVALATTHLPLAAVPGAITRELLGRRLAILIDELETRFGILGPRIAVAGLNPHAGEGGHLGREEIDVIGPVCEAFRRRGARVVGPLPADSIFVPDRLEETDAVLAMYHDQGLPVVKHHGFGEAVNVTLGLPFVRTSVDHGTALDLAGDTRRADGRSPDPGSLREALRLAAELAG